MLWTFGRLCSGQRRTVTVLAVLLSVLFWPANITRSAPRASKTARAKHRRPKKVPAAPSPTPKPTEAVPKPAEALTTRKSFVLLDEAQRLQSEGSNPQAKEAILGVLKETNDEKVLDKAKALLENNQPTTYAKLGLSQATLLKTASWWIDILLGILILLALYVALRLARFIWSATQRGKWRLEPIADTTGLGVADLIIESLGRWGNQTLPLTSGLLTLERLQLPSVQWLRPSSTQLDLSDALKDLSIKIGGGLVGLTGIASAGKGIRNWLNTTCPAIRGKAIVNGSNLMVSLTTRSSDGTVVAVTESRTKTSTDPNATAAPEARTFDTMTTSGPSPFDPDDIQGAAESASYKLFYLISRKGSSMAQAEAANSLREGLNQLWGHVSTQDPDKLDKAYEAFREARTREDDFYEAYLYEGIALDLLSQHDEAIKRFEYLENESEERLKDQTLREKAIYNKAISLFRKYQHPAAQKAEGVLNNLIDQIKEAPEVSQIKSMALAAKASVIAQHPMYWTILRPNGNESAAPGSRITTKSEAEVTQWMGEVAKLKEQLKDILETVKLNGNWRRGAERQLEWAINNAWGTAHLNAAIYVHSNPDAKDTPPEWKKKRFEYLNEAYDAFQNCAMILTPGVENLTSLAKVTLELGRFAQGCSYLEQVRRMNPSYEYAYFRLAKEWDKIHDTEKVVKILKSYLEKGTPAIPAFVAFIESYKSELNK
jgi:tetratricopeptide (TPR) repeat protein